MKFEFENIVPKNAVEVTFFEGIGEPRFVEKESGSSEFRFPIKKYDEINRRKFISLLKLIIREAKKYRVESIAINFNFPFKYTEGLDKKELSTLIGENFVLANYEFTSHKTEPNEGWAFVNNVVILGDSGNDIKEGFDYGALNGDMVNVCRDLANTPGGDMTPTILASKAEKLAKDADIKIDVMGEKEMEKLGMGAVLGVSKGSEEESQFIVMEYWGANKNEAPIVLVGKGVTFDTGGLSLKPADGMVGMNHDMTGGATVISAITLAAKHKLKKNVVVLVPAVENSPSGKAYRPGDILKSLSGKMIEVLNTDAEGRVILADALTYAKKYNPKLVIDVATLTGAAVIAVGERTSAFFTTDDSLALTLSKYGEKVGDYVWRLPLWEEYKNDIKGIHGDITNIGQPQSKRAGGSITAAVFLHEFAKDYPWIHIDIASRDDSIPEDNLAKGATGEPVRLLLKMIENI